MLAVDTHLKVQMRTGGPAGGADLGNRLNRCVTGEYACTRKRGQCCKFQKIFREVSEDVRAKLYSYKFSDFVE